ncbi:MAG TPA: hypothetical protein VMM78_06670, partial [Thermomicrobiales bacterium]|nr:hypothetical protein [Thermomicrobiales bacterium]
METLEPVRTMSPPGPVTTIELSTASNSVRNPTRISDGVTGTMLDGAGLEATISPCANPSSAAPIDNSRTISEETRMQ